MSEIQKTSYFSKEFLAVYLKKYIWKLTIARQQMYEYLLGIYIYFSIHYTVEIDNFFF